MVAVVAILVVAGLAVAVWRLIATQYEERQGTPNRPRPSRPKRAPSVAPDDDPEFLAELARRTKRNEDNS